MSDQQLLQGVRESARRLGAGRDQVYAWVREGRLPCIRIGARILIPSAALERFVDDEVARQRAAAAEDQPRAAP